MHSQVREGETMLKFNNTALEEVCRNILTEDENRFKKVGNVFIPICKEELLCLEKQLSVSKLAIKNMERAILISKLAVDMKSDLVEVDEDVDLSGIDQSEF